MVSFDSHHHYRHSEILSRFDPWGAEDTHSSEQLLVKPESKPKSPLVSPLSSTFSSASSSSYEQNIKLQLLGHPGVLNEMRLITQRRIQQQRRQYGQDRDGHGDGKPTSAPCLFVILPNLSMATTATGSEVLEGEGHRQQGQEQQQQQQQRKNLMPIDARRHPLYHHEHDTAIIMSNDFRLHFLCDFGSHDEHTNDHSRPHQETGRQQRHGSSDQTIEEVAAATAQYGHDAQKVMGHFTSSFLAADSEAPSSTSVATMTPRLHVCEPTRGYVLKDVESFCQIHRMPLLSLLRALRTSVTISAEQHSNDLTHDTHTTTTTTTTTSSSSSSSSLLLQRIDMATQYVLQFFSPFDLESILQSSIHSDMHDDDGLVFAANALPSLQSKDFAEVDLARINKSMTSDGRILGPLIQSPQPPTATTATSAPMTATAVRWLCSDHTQACCEAQIREKMKAAIALNGGSSMEHERLAEIQFKSRERAKEFYALLREFKCVAKLHIHLAWRGLTDEDLWELGEVIHKAGITELALDCACVAEDDHQQPKHPQQQQQQPLNFKPVLGMLFLPRLMSFTINNFSATLPALNAFNFGTYANDTFSLQDFRDSPALTLPASNSLSTLAFNNCGPGTQAQQMTELLRHSPLLTDVRLECDRIDSALAKIEEATNQMDKITFVKLSESAWESAEMTYGRDYSDGNSSSAGDMENRQPSTLKCLNRKTQRLLNIHLQDLGVLERLTTCTYLELWDKHQTTLATLIAQNPRLHTLELMCEVQSMDRLWRFLISHYQHHQQIQQLKQEEHEMSQMDLLDLPQANPYQQQPPPPTYFSHHSPSAASSSKFLHLHLYDKSCSLMVYTPVFNVFVLNDYTDAQRQLMHSLEDITTAICIGSGFHDPEQLALLRMHLEEDGAFKFKSLTWVLTPKLQNDPYFLEQLRALVTSQCAITHFTIRVYAPLFDIRSLVRAWNWIVDAAWLSEEEHGRWIQTCLEHEKEEGGRSGADSLSTTAPNAGGTGDGGEESLNAARTAALSKRATAQTMHLPGHGTMQSYTLPLDEHNQLILASSHFYFPSAFASSIKGAQTAATYSLTLDRTEDGHGLLV